MSHRQLAEIARRHNLALGGNETKGSSFTTVFMRSGHSYSKRLHSLVVQNNAMRMKAVKSEVVGSVKSAVGSQRTDCLVPNSSRATSRPFMKHVRFGVLGKTQRDEDKLLQLAPSGSSQTRRSALKTPSDDPFNSARTIRKVLYPSAPETAPDFYQTVTFIAYMIGKAVDYFTQ